MAGIGLLATISTSLTAALSDGDWREPAVVTFLATVSLTGKKRQRHPTVSPASRTVGACPSSPVLRR
ncbi:MULTISPECIES: benzoate/H(+) symporter BenE family transporter [Streptomyces]|uniref:benzoate/H(+) symporter BenE family transporter n=1 Tax=Streptomyces sp. Z423-1 TaxID=2730915 RepID=UPI001488B142